MRTAVVWNPHGGRGRATRLKPRAEALLSSMAAHWVETTGPGSAAAQASYLARSGFELVVAAGGDGTVSQVAAGLLGTGATLAILPFGTGNDLARCVGIGTSVEVACQAISGGRTQNVDVARWSCAGRDGTFINVAGGGFDGEVAHAVNNDFRWTSGSFAYLLAIFRTLAQYKPIDVEVEVDGEKDAGKAMLCAVANATSYGGGLRIAPTASLTDGKLDVVRVGELGKMEFVLNFAKLMRGTHLSHPKVKHLRGSSVTLRTPDDVPFLVDGELLPGGDVRIEVMPRVLPLVFPNREHPSISSPR